MLQRLIAEPPALPCLPLTDLLDTISQMYPQIFYKPLFACAASNKELAVQNYMAVLTVIARYLPDFWTRDAEMISVALMSEGGNKSTNVEAGVTWGRAKLGQSALLTELIAHVQGIRLSERSSNVRSFFVIGNAWFDLVSYSKHLESSHNAAAKFFNALETRLNILLDAKVCPPFVTSLLHCVYSFVYRKRLCWFRYRSEHFLPSCFWKQGY